MYDVVRIPAEFQLKRTITGQYSKETYFQPLDWPPSWALRNLIASEGCDSSFGWGCDSYSSSSQGSASFLDYVLYLGCNRINHISSDLPGKLHTDTNISYPRLLMSYKVLGNIKKTQTDVTVNTQTSNKVRQVTT